MLSRSLDTRDERVPFTAGKYILTRSGVFTKACDGSLLPFEYNESGEPFAIVDFGYGEVKMKVAVLLAIRHKAIKVPFNSWKDLDVLYIDGDPSNYDPSNTVWKFPSEGIKSNVNSDFRYIPGFSRYQINLDGAVYSNCTHKNLSPYTDGMGYSIYGVAPDVGKRTIVGMHRLLALAFLEYPAEVDTLDVNHLDGVKNHNWLSNLEWAKRKRNCDHAYSTGLRSDNVVTLVRNIYSGEVKEFYSIEECARKLKVDGETVRLRLNMGGGKVYFPGYQLKRKDDLQPWREVTDPFEEIRRTSVNVPLMVEDLNTGTIEQHIGQESVARRLGVSRSAVYFHMKNNVREKVVRNFRIFYPDFERLSLSSFAEM